MKKITLVLCMCALILGLTACGGSSDKKELSADQMTTVESMTQDLVENMYNALPKEESEEFISYGSEYMELVCENYFGYKVDGNAIIKGFDSWYKALDEIGAYQSVTDMEAGYDEQGKDIIVVLHIKGENRTAQVEAIYKDDLYNSLKSITTNVDYTFGEKMAKAGLNTLMGMGTVFVVLILISLIIGLFGYIPKLAESFKKSGTSDEKSVAVDNTIAQIIEKEEQSDDFELVAVITAAIAACGTSGSADDFVVRSIKRRSKSQWNKAN